MTEAEMERRHDAIKRRARLNVGSALVVIVLLSLGLWALIWLAASAALAHDHDVPFAEWMMSLMRPDYPSASCCGPADQFYAVEYHEDPDEPGGFVVRTEELPDPIHVPPEKVDWKDVNPTGRGVIFVSHDVEYSAEAYTVYCFVPGTGT
jgi:hypothetical protein